MYANGKMNAIRINDHGAPGKGLRRGIGSLAASAAWALAAIVLPLEGAQDAVPAGRGSAAGPVSSVMALELADALAPCAAEKRGLFVKAYKEQLRQGGGATFEDAVAFHALEKETVAFFRSRWRPLEEERRKHFEGRILEDGSVVKPWCPGGADGAGAKENLQRQASSGARLVRLVLADGSAYVLPMAAPWFAGWERHGFGSNSCWEALVPVESLEGEIGLYLARMGIGELSIQWGPGLPAGVKDDAENPKTLVEKFDAAGQNLPPELAGKWSTFQGRRLAKRHWACYQRDYDPARLEELVARERSELERWGDDEERKTRLQAAVAALGEAYGMKILERERARESVFLKELARQPNVVLLPRGVQCVVEPGEDSVEELDRAVVMTGLDYEVCYVENDVGFGFLPDFVRDAAAALPKGTSWTFWIPGSAFEWTREQQQREEREKLLDELVPAQRAHRRGTEGTAAPKQEAGRLMMGVKVWKSGKEKAAP